ncbi:DNA mismatch repair endonuclease MutL [Bacillus luteolus]|uniref:DNA mismatch repair protein MutL n=1 Tax=Litchfieldia luteola TaxID=682179 RepID=A0ABR9QJH4_9BACI|nr:DNA mismatch repair endonuclease MutL [Cytobacillus luteolus]MBE4908644.1 DNA mismatch repair endonuclease MutL [Cytobacillus luteolus]MBP1941500.1 DNA mismatch repair protein MutL [Cytobacillus luteolus]
MGKIIKLVDQLSNKIAAGEVVERPASVVKELVENAIDAKSTIIEIEVEEAGLSKIRIIDNGEGIEEDDCLNAFHRHATSKIKDENDLFRIRTLGFRGEALPSIASVSELEMKTSTGDSFGTHLILKGGDIIKQERTNSRKGTDITVSNLFYNTPARLKYMKTVHTELGNITDIINRIAMAHPGISFRLSHNGKRMLYTSGNGDVLQVIAAIYGMSIAKKMIPIDIQSLDFQVKGYVSLPEVTRASRNYMSLIINGRFIKNYSIAKAIQQGYHTLLPIGRYPIVFLEVEMDPLIVDVNVHPAKMEVRLSKEAELNELIEAGIKAVFKKKSLYPDITPTQPKKKQVNPLEQQQFNFEHRETQKKGYELYSTFDDDSIDTLDKDTVSVDTFSFSQEETLQYPVKTTPIDLAHNSIVEKQELDLEKHEEFIEKVESKQLIQPVEKKRIPPLYPIGQMHGTYILAQNENGLFIVDQHAAQERIKYEYYKNKVAEVISEVQEMLVPITLEYSTDETILISAHVEDLAKVGVFLEPFGHNCFIVRSHPRWFPRGQEVFVIEEMIEQVLNYKKIDIKKLREEAAIMMSCKASIKANHHLRNEDMFTLLETLRGTSDPFTCPHGRPIIIHFTTYEMEKLFKRVM